MPYIIFDIIMWIGVICIPVMIWGAIKSIRDINKADDKSEDEMNQLIEQIKNVRNKEEYMYAKDAVELFEHRYKNIARRIDYKIQILKGALKTKE